MHVSIKPSYSVQWHKAGFHSVLLLLVSPHLWHPQFFSLTEGCAGLWLHTLVITLVDGVRQTVWLPLVWDGKPRWEGQNPNSSHSHEKKKLYGCNHGHSSASMAPSAARLSSLLLGHQMSPVTGQQLALPKDPPQGWGEERKQGLPGPLRGWGQARTSLGVLSKEKMKLDSHFQLSCTHFVLSKVSNCSVQSLSLMGSAHGV